MNEKTVDWDSDEVQDELMGRIGSDIADGTYSARRRWIELGQRQSDTDLESIELAELELASALIFTSGMRQIIPGLTFDKAIDLWTDADWSILLVIEDGTEKFTFTKIDENGERVVGATIDAEWGVPQ